MTMISTKATASIIAGLSIALSAGCQTAADRSGYDSAWELRVSGPPKAVVWRSPAASVAVDMAGEVWTVVLRDPAELTAVGLTRASFENANVVAIQGYAHVDRPLEIRANTVTLDGKTTTLR